MMNKKIIMIRIINMVVAIILLKDTYIEGTIRLFYMYKAKTRTTAVTLNIELGLFPFPMQNSTLGTPAFTTFILPALPISIFSRVALMNLRCSFKSVRLL